MATGETRVEGGGMNLWQRWVQKLTGNAEIKAISHRPDLAGREHISSSYAYDAPPMSDFLGYATVYGSYVWVAKAINKIADNFVGLPVRVVDGNDQPLDSHPLSVLLAHVNDEETPADLWSAYIIHKLLAGESFVEIVPDSRNRPVELWMRRPDWMLVRPDATRLNYPRAAEYVYTPDMGGPLTLGAQWVIHDKFYNPLQPWRGLAPIAAVREGITIDLFSQAWSKSFIKNNARPDFALVAPQGITRSERDAYLSEFTRTHAGAGNHLPVVLEQGVTDIKTFSFAPKDMEWLEQRRFSRDEVGAIFGVPDEIMGYGKDTYENFQTALEVFWTLTIQPMAARRDLVLTNHCRKAGWLRDTERIATDLSDVGVLQEDVAPKVAMAIQLWDRGVPWNVLDKRFGLGIGAIPGGKTGYVPSSMTPVEMAALQLEQARTPPPEPEPPTPPPPAPDETQGEPVDEDAERAAEVRRLRTWAKKRPGADVTQFRSTILSDADKAAIIGEGAATEQDFFTLPDGPLTPDVIKALLLQLDPDDDEAEWKLRQLTERKTKRALTEAMDEILQGITHSEPETMFEMDERTRRYFGYDQAMYDALSRALQDGADLGVSAAVRQFESIGYGFDWTMVNTQARTWAEQYSGELIRDIERTTLDGVRQATGRWMGNGEPLQALIDDLTPLFGPQRAARIAATEVTRSYAQANLIAYRESGVVSEMEWRAANDERVCPVCGPRHGTRAKLDASFGGLFPPAHVNCRCWIVPVVKEAQDD